MRVVLCLSMAHTAASFSCNHRPATCRGVAAVSMELDRRNLLLAGGAAGLLSFGGAALLYRRAPPKIACVLDGFGNCVPSALASEICEFNRGMNGGGFNDKSYASVRRAMSNFGLSARTTREAYGVQVDVGHIIPDPSKKVRDDREDFGWNLFAQPHDENVRLGHRTAPCEMTARWCRSGVSCSASAL